MAPARLVTLPLSHYCEKARWALDCAGVAYVEEGHAPLFHLRATRPHGGKSVPLLIDGATVLTDSTPILAHADRAAPPGRKLLPVDAGLRAEALALEEMFDTRLGPATRRYAYFHILPERAIALGLLCGRVPRGEAAILRVLFPAVRVLMRRLMKVDAEGAERSRVVVGEVFAEVSARLADGRRYLVGDAFSVADLTFAALSAPVLLPEEFGMDLPRTIPQVYQAIVDAHRATPAGAFALRLYREERGQSIAATPRAASAAQKPAGSAR